ncbi:MAG TPA: peptidylprolyl isomerase [Spirochaetia bacterium]|jgi:peptidylprolyl isomerase|nr:peptidylprolyl isomerase [Spirochaetia bacterium]
MKRNLIPLFAVLWTLVCLPGLAVAGPVKASSLEAIQKNGDGLYAVITTAKGDIVLSLEYQKTPLTVTNFVALAEGSMTGKPFYDGLKFHRVIANFMIQGGDPQGTGAGGPGYQFADEFDPSLRFTGPGVLAMANAGAGTNGSQFFITHVKTDWLNGKHTIFGHVVAGQDVVNAVAQNDVMEKVTIVRQGKDAEAFKATKTTFEALKSTVASRTALAAQKALDQLTVGMTKTASGLYYKVTKAGSGSKPSKGQTILANYEGRLTDGSVFDSSYARKQPFEFQVGVGNVIPGWDEALMDMKTGEKRTIVIPPNLGYGARGAGGVIPPNAWLVFDVELVLLK